MPAANRKLSSQMRAVMSARNPVSEDELEEVFAEDPEYGVCVLYEEYDQVILAYIKKHGWGLKLEDWLDVLQQTMLEFIEKVRTPDFDHRKPLALVFTIAGRRIRDLLRRKKFRANTDSDVILAHIAKDYNESDVGIGYRHADVDWNLFRENLHEVIAELPERQRIVARVFVDNYEDFRANDTYGPLATLVGEVTGQVESVVAVKNAWYEAKRKIVREMTHRGFNFLQPE